MFKFVGGVFALSVAALIFAVIMKWPTMFHQLQITVVLGGIFLKVYFSHQRETEQAEAIWGKYERTDKSKVPHYHDL